MFKTITIPVYGIRLKFTSNSNFFLQELKEDYKYFRSKSERISVDANVFIQVVNDLGSIPINYSDLEANKVVKKILIDGKAKFRISIFNNEWIVIEGLPKNVTFLINPVHNIYHGYTTKENLSIYHFITEIIVNILSKHLIRRKICCIHAAALSKKNSGILFPGKAGSGKTTLSIILTRSGYKFLSDDYPLILGKTSHFEILAFPLRLKVRSDTLNRFLEFRTYVFENEIQATRPYIHISKIYHDCVIRKAKLKFIVFPVLTSGATDYKILSKDEALQKLLPCVFDPFPYVQKDPSIRKAIFEMAYDLVRDLECYNLFVGRDFDQIRDAVDAILDQNSLKK